MTTQTTEIQVKIEKKTLTEDQQKSSFFYWQAQKFFEAGRFPQAQKLLEESVKLDSENASAIAMSFVLSPPTSFDAVAKMLEYAVAWSEKFESNPHKMGHGRPPLNESRSLYLPHAAHFGHWESVESVALKILESDPKRSFLAMGMYGCACLALKKPETFLAAWTKYDGRDVVEEYARAFALFATKGDCAEAQASLTKARGTSPHVSVALLAAQKPAFSMRANILPVCMLWDGVHQIEAAIEWLRTRVEGKKKK